MTCLHHFDANIRLKVNCLTEIFFEGAIAKAKELDQLYETTKKVIGPLHGLPISLKDSFSVKGIHTTLGYVSYVSKPPIELNSTIIGILLSQGAILYVKTNIPQTMMTADSDNPLFGRTLNPRNLLLTAGGSTGGEGALIAMRGSPLGVGTDVGGSIRIPALCNGIYGFKPTSGRVPFGGNTYPGRLVTPSPILPVVGPEGHSIRDLELFMETMMKAEPWELDDGCLRVPWREVASFQRPLRIGVILEDLKRPLHPSMLRTMNTAIDRLKAQGHMLESLDSQIPSVWDIAVQAWKYFMLDPQKTAFKYATAAGEPLVKSIFTMKVDELEGFQPSLDELWDMNLARKQITSRFHKVMHDLHLDAILMPPYQATAVPHDTWGVPIYTVFANFLDWPAAVMPFLEANEVKDKEFARSVTYIPPCKCRADLSIVIEMLICWCR
jgi:amidase